jgi:hypothetical protein
MIRQIFPNPHTQPLRAEPQRRADQVDTEDLRRWLAKARDIQWDYKNIARRKGRLGRLK